MDADDTHMLWRRTFPIWAQGIGIMLVSRVEPESHIPRLTCGHLAFFNFSLMKILEM